MFHKIKDVEALENMILKVKFIDNTVKIYNVKRLIDRWEIFKSLNDNKFFQKVKVDQGGYGISWNEHIDIDCNELWNNGKDDV